MRRELKRRTAIEPMIGHAKCDGRLGRNWLLGTEGDKTNAVLAAAGHNLRLVLKKLERLLAQILGAIASVLAPDTLFRAVTTTQSAFADVCIDPACHANSTA